MRGVFLILTLTSCHLSKESVRRNHEDRGEASPSAEKPQKTPDFETNAAVTRLTPEQVVNTLGQSFQVFYGMQDPETLVVYHYITGHLAVPLGGVDYQLNGPVRNRDRLTKAQSLLVSRAVAWPVAIKLIEREEEDPPSQESLFTLCSFTDDYPSKDAESRERWIAQLRDFYVRLFSREITPEEVALHEAAFNRVFLRDGSTNSAWLITFYALISTMETWNSWR